MSKMYMKDQLGNFRELAPGNVAPSSHVAQQDATFAVPVQRDQPGPLRAYYNDLASGMLPPENMRIENLEYRVRIDPAGEIQQSTQAVQIISQYNFALRRIAGFAMNPSGLGNAGGLISFNVQEQGRSFFVFKKPISFGSVIATSGAGNLAEWDGTYVCVPGTQLEVTWTIDTPRWAALVGATREVGVQLIGDYVICRGTSGF